MAVTVQRAHHEAEDGVEWAVARSVAAVRESFDGTLSVRTAVGRTRLWLSEAFGQQAAASILEAWNRRLEAHTRQARRTGNEPDAALVSLYRGERRRSRWVRRLGDAAVELAATLVPTPAGGALAALAGEAVTAIPAAAFAWMEAPARPDTGRDERAVAQVARFSQSNPVWRQWAVTTLLEAVDAYLSEHDITADATQTAFGPAVRTAASL